MARGRHSRTAVKNIIGIGLMALGVVVVACYIPFWAWLTLLGTSLIILGIICIWG